MTVASTFLPEFDTEFANTRKFLELIPDDKLMWKPHDKSMELGRLAWHMSDFPSWVQDTLTKPGLSLSAEDGDKYANEWKGKTRKDIVERFDRDLPQARATLSGISDADFEKHWKMEWNGQTFIDDPRQTVYRSMIVNHMIHHRAQLGVYYRMLNIPIPGVYGPSADEMPS